MGSPDQQIDKLLAVLFFQQCQIGLQHMGRGAEQLLGT